MDEVNLGFKSVYKVDLVIRSVDEVSLDLWIRWTSASNHQSSDKVDLVLMAVCEVSFVH